MRVGGSTSDLPRAPRQCVILVGGLGTRLGELTRATPKPLLPVEGEPFLAHLIRHVVRFGFSDIVLLCGYKAEQFDALTQKGHFGAAEVRICMEPPTLLGTGGALRHAAPALDQTFVLMNGDTLFDFNLLDLTAGFAGGDAIGRVALRPQNAAGRYGSVVLDDGKITQFASDVEGAGLINGGVYVLSRGVVDAIPEGPCSLERDVFPALAIAGRLQGRVYDGAFLDIGVPDDLARAGSFLSATRVKAAAFLDRDGVLNHDDGYTHRPEQLRWIDGAAEAVKLLNDRGFYVFVVTNQSGVARGRYGVQDVEGFHRHMNEELRASGGHVDAFEYCPFHVDGVVPEFTGPSVRRKPEPGMILDLLRAWPVDVAGSFLIGDRNDDVQAARAAGIKGHLFTGGDLCAAVSAIVGHASGRT